MFHLESQPVFSDSIFNSYFLPLGCIGQLILEPYVHAALLYRIPLVFHFPFPHILLADPVSFYVQISRSAVCCLGYYQRRRLERLQSCENQVSADDESSIKSLTYAAVAAKISTLLASVTSVKQTENRTVNPQIAPSLAPISSTKYSARIAVIGMQEEKMVLIMLMVS